MRVLHNQWTLSLLDVQIFHLRSVRCAHVGFSACFVDDSGPRTCGYPTRVRCWGVRWRVYTTDDFPDFCMQTLHVSLSWEGLRARFRHLSIRWSDRFSSLLSASSSAAVVSRWCAFMREIGAVKRRAALVISAANPLIAALPGRSATTNPLFVSLFRRPFSQTRSFPHFWGSF